MKSFWKIVRRLIHQLALSIGYLIIVAALLLAALFAIIEITETKDSKEEIRRETFNSEETVKEAIVEVDNAPPEWPYCEYTRNCR